MTTKTDGERLERVETNLENLTTLVKETNENVKSIQLAQQEARVSNVTRVEMESALTMVRSEVKESRRKNSLQVWLTGSLSALFGSVLTLLIAFFISNIAL